MVLDMLRALHARRLTACVLSTLLFGLTAEAGETSSPSLTPGRLAVVELDTPPTMIGLGAQVVQRVIGAARQQGYTVVAPEQVEQALGRASLEELKKCKGQPTCVAARLSTLGVQHAVVGSLNRDDRAYLVKLTLVDVERAQIVAEIDRGVLIASRRLQQDVDEAVPRLLRGEGEARGRLVVTSTAKNAEVWIDGALRGTTPLELELKPGRYEVKVVKRAYLPLQRWVDVAANETSENAFRLLLQPGAVDEEAEIPALVAQPTTNEARELRITLPAWIAFGAAAATGATGMYFGIQSQQLERSLKGSFDATNGIYGGTRAEALAGRQKAQTANILFGVAGAAAVSGVLFAVFDVGGAEVAAVPTAGPDAAGVQVGGQF